MDCNYTFPINMTPNENGIYVGWAGDGMNIVFAYVVIFIDRHELDSTPSDICIYPCQNTCYLFR